MNDTRLQRAAADTGNDVITKSGEQRPEMEVGNLQRSHVFRVSYWKPSVHRQLISVLLLLLSLMTSQSVAISGKSVNEKRVILCIYTVIQCYRFRSFVLLITEIFIDHSDHHHHHHHHRVLWQMLTRATNKM